MFHDPLTRGYPLLVDTSAYDAGDVHKVWCQLKGQGRFEQARPGNGEGREGEGRRSERERAGEGDDHDHAVMMGFVTLRPLATLMAMTGRMPGQEGEDRAAPRGCDLQRTSRWTCNDLDFPFPAVGVPGAGMF